MNEVILSKKVDDSIIITELSERYNIELPKDVIDFLMNNSRGILKEKRVKNSEDLFVSGFVSVHSEDECNIKNLAVLINLDKNFVLIPVAMNSIGGYYCLKFVQNRFLEIEFFDTETNSYKYICKNFENFLDLLDL